MAKRLVNGLPYSRLAPLALPRWRTIPTVPYAEGFLVVALATLAAAAQTYPYAFRMGSGGRLDAMDGQFGIWVVAWVARAILTDPRHLYDANIFYPHQGTLAFSEAHLFAGFLATPLYWASGNPYLAHNFVFVLSFVLSAVGAYYLVRRLTGSRGAASVAAVLFAFCPYIFARTAHIQLLMTAGLPFSMLALHRLVDSPSALRAVVLGVILACQGLSSGYYGLFGGMMVGVGVLYYALVRRLWRSANYWAMVVLAAAVSGALVAPFLIPYLGSSEGGAFAERTLQEARVYSADWRAYLASPARSHAWLLKLIGRWKDVLFPGFLTLLLAAVGIASTAFASRRADAEASARREDAYPQPETTWLYLLIAVLALWMSFGPDAYLYTLFYSTIPGFSLIRAPSRAGIVVAFALAALAGIGVASILRRSRFELYVAAALASLAIVELSAAPLPFRAAAPVEPVIRLLARLPDGPVAAFPFYNRRDTFAMHVPYMLESTAHWKPLINGYSDHFPQDYRDMVVPMSTFPSAESFRLLKSRGVRYVLIHLHRFSDKDRATVIAGLEKYKAFLKPLWRTGNIWLLEVESWPE
jgi:hypothetical protein